MSQKRYLLGGVYGLAIFIYILHSAVLNPDTFNSNHNRRNHHSDHQGYENHNHNNINPQGGVWFRSADFHEVRDDERRPNRRVAWATTLQPLPLSANILPQEEIDFIAYYDVTHLRMPQKGYLATLRRYTPLYERRPEDTHLLSYKPMVVLAPHVVSNSDCDTLLRRVQTQGLQGITTTTKEFAPVFQTVSRLYGVLVEPGALLTFRGRDRVEEQNCTDTCQLIPIEPDKDREQSLLTPEARIVVFLNTVGGNAGVWIPEANGNEEGVDPSVPYCQNRRGLFLRPEQGNVVVLYVKGVDAKWDDTANFYLCSSDKESEKMSIYLTAVYSMQTSQNDRLR
eukprot:PhF_6_TR8673/c0_g1_i2/m.13567